MIDPASAAAVAGVVRDGAITAPLYGSYCFSSIAPTVEWLLGADAGPALPRASLGPLSPGDGPVVLVLIDAFGWAFLERHSAHPLVRRFVDDGHVVQLTSQFPSTTSAHLTTLSTGLTVGESGVYEWFQREPTLDAVIAPLLFAYAGDLWPGGLLRAGVVPRELFRFETVYERLGRRGLRSVLHGDASYTPSSYSQAILAGAEQRGFRDLDDGIAALAASVGEPVPPAYSMLYVDTVDAIGHRAGPDAAVFDAEIERVLDLLERQLVPALPAGATLLLTADHGQVAVDPARTMYLNALWPEIEQRLRRNGKGAPFAPAGSPRDLFLHVLPDAVDEVVGTLAGLLGARARVAAVDELLRAGLFGPRVSQLLRDRLGDVVVLPGRGETAWWYEPGRFEQRFYGHHGGLDVGEALTYLAALVI